MCTAIFSYHVCQNVTFGNSCVINIIDSGNNILQTRKIIKSFFQKKQNFFSFMLTVVTVRFRKALSRRKINSKTSLCISVMSSTWPRGIAFALGRVPSSEDHRPGYAPRECKTDDAEHCRRFCFCAVYNKSYRKQDSRNDRSCQCTCIQGPLFAFPGRCRPG